MLYDKNVMEASAYAAAMANEFGEAVLLVESHVDDNAVAVCQLSKTDTCSVAVCQMSKTYMSYNICMCCCKILVIERYDAQWLDTMLPKLGYRWPPLEYLGALTTTGIPLCPDYHWNTLVP